MKHILDSDFRYRPSFDTDVRRTFERIRRTRSLRDRAQTTANADAQVKVLKIDQLKKASST